MRGAFIRQATALIVVACLVAMTLLLGGVA